MGLYVTAAKRRILTFNSSLMSSSTLSSPKTRTALLISSELKTNVTMLYGHIETMEERI